MQLIQKLLGTLVGPIQGEFLSFQIEKRRTSESKRKTFYEEKYLTKFVDF